MSATPTTRRRLAIAALGVLVSCTGGDREPGDISGSARPIAEVTAADTARAATRDRLAGAKQVLFGDLHVHTTYSVDAFTMELPMMGLQGVHTPADACDFARHCAHLDFFSLNDHAENLTPEHWAATKDVIRRCNALGGDPDDQDLVAFAGWEWTQVGLTAEQHWGHKNVIFPGIEDDELPARPITSRPDDAGLGLFENVRSAISARWLDPLHWKAYADLGWLLDRLAQIPDCPRGVDTRELPPDCHENAATPEVLYEKLDQWGFPVLVIPHGNAWGLYTPPLASWRKALGTRQHDPAKQRLIEIMSGHGNSEVYRAFRPVERDEAGEPVCPAPTPDFLPCCWQAGEIMRQRCDDLSPDECEARVADARRLAAEAGSMHRLVFPDAPAEAWLDCDQCRDCYKPAFSYRPLESTQYAMSLSSFDEQAPDGRPLRFRFGFIASTDDHTARPGTGYKQYARRMMTMATGPASSRFSWPQRDADPQVPQAVDEPYLVPDAERLSSFAYPGGIVAVHAAGRSREAIWDALERRETYGTSGPRILLWFDLLNGPEGVAPMGSEVTMAGPPRFQVRAAGDFVQEPGCPGPSLSSLSSGRIDYLCAGECYNPSNTRHRITRIEIVRIRPQREPDEDPGRLIDDPWRLVECPPDPAGCVVTVEDEDFPDGGRDVLYYARAIQEATPAVNAAGLRTEFDRDGNAVSVSPCFGDWRTPLDDDCLAPAEERAWSSPVFVNHAGTASRD